MKYVYDCRAWMYILVIALFIGCATTVAPQTPAQRLAVADGQFTALVNTAADLRSGGIIDDELFKEIDPLIQNGATALDAGWLALEVGDVSTAESQIKLLNTVLWELRARLPKEGE